MESNTTQTKGKCLVVADQALRGDQVRDRLIQELGGNPAEVFVVAPALVEKALDHHMGDVDDARVTAQERLEETLEELRAAGIKAEGEVGDSDPLLAISDEVTKFAPTGSSSSPIPRARSSTPSTTCCRASSVTSTSPSPS